jgi:hypothetical protein
MDEPLAALDPGAEYALNHSIAENLKDQTVGTVFLNEEERTAYNGIDEASARFKTYKGDHEMMDNRNSCFSGVKDGRKDSVCIDSMRILDSCRDKDCYEDVRVFLTDFGQDVIEKAGSVRVKDTKVVCVNIQADPIQFNKGFYQITVRMYTKLCVEACLCPGKVQELEGIAVTEKKVVLYGGEGCARVFKSTPLEGGFCTELCDYEEGSNKPTVVLELVDPIALSAKIKEPCRQCCCCCCVEELPKPVCGCLNGGLVDHGGLNKHLYVSLGFFSVVRVERPGQFIVSAEEYCIPDKECIISDEEEPCRIFEKMSFPVSQFCPGSVAPPFTDCGCKKK